MEITAAKKITFPSEAECQKIGMNKAGNGQQTFKPFKALPGDQWACFMLRVDANTTAEDLATVSTGIGKLAKVLQASLMVDMPTLPGLVDDLEHEYQVVGEVNFRMRDIPAPEELQM